MDVSFQILFYGVPTRRPFPGPSNWSLILFPAFPVWSRQIQLLYLLQLQLYTIQSCLYASFCCVGACLGCLLYPPFSFRGGGVGGAGGGATPVVPLCRDFIDHFTPSFAERWRVALSTFRMKIG